tara:strand:- start:2636 stop:3319 length:684 start_codon:yes stop_codon:yes gene_type:complete
LRNNWQNKSEKKVDRDPELTEKVALIFDHPEGVDWHWEDAADRIAAGVPVEPKSFDILEAAFVHFETYLAPYSPWQIAMGTSFLLDSILSPHVSLFSDERLDIERRVAVVRGLRNVFADTFKLHAEWEYEGGAGVQKDINNKCYMFWETCPLPFSPSRPIAEACIDVMESCLTIPNMAVIESGLHGLGHSARSYPRAVQIVEQYIAAGKCPADLVEYAQSAAKGRVL